MTCAGCGLPLAPANTMQTAAGLMHRICATIARLQSQKPGGAPCFKHGIPLDDTGWCEACRLLVSE